VGLSAVEQDLRALGGRLSVESEPGRGCSWIIAVPATKLGAVGAEPDSTLRARNGERSERATAPA
jgi:hypothetical protein